MATRTPITDRGTSCPQNIQVERASVASNGTETNAFSFLPDISASGRYIAYTSFASTLVSGDTNGVQDVFVYDRKTDTTERVSVASDGTEGNSFSEDAAISANGRYVAYTSGASNLVPGDTNGVQDVFVYDQKTDTTKRVSVASDGTEGNNVSSTPDISANGRYVAYSSIASNLVPDDTNNNYDIFVYDRERDTTERVSVASNGTEGNAFSFSPAISANGRYVAYYSEASNLVPGDTNGVQDVFVYDRKTDTTKRVPVASDGTEGNSFSEDAAISANGRYVAYTSGASNLVPGDTNGVQDVFVYDQKTDTTKRVSVASDGTEGNNVSSTPDISANGRYLTYTSGASNLVPSDTNGTDDIFLFDWKTDTTERISLASDGTEANDPSFDPAISAHGRYVAYASFASNLVPGDTNGTADIFAVSTDPWLV